MLRPYGMHPDAWSAYIQACYDAALNPDRIEQTIGNAPASAGFHLPDGTFVLHDHRENYCAATDLGVRSVMTAKILRLCDCLTAHGFFAFYRQWIGNIHVHALFAAVAMKPQLQRQAHDWFKGLDGTNQHAVYVFGKPLHGHDDALRAGFLEHNPATPPE